MNESPSKPGEKLRGESIDGRFSDQQTLVWNRMRQGLTEIQEANRDFSSRASTVIGASSAVLAVSSLAAVLSENDGSGAEMLACLAGVVFLASMHLAASIWIPQDGWVAGTSDVQVLHEEYIDSDLDDAHCAALTDMACVYEDERQRNGFLASRLQLMIFSLDAQVVLMILVMLSAIFGW